MKIVENNLAKEFIELVISKKILELNPVIAGGFVVAIYHAFMAYEDKRFKRIMERKLESLKNGYEFSDKEIDIYFNMHKMYKDVDFWFLEENPIWQSKDNILIRDFQPDKPDKLISPLHNPNFHVNNTFYTSSAAYQNDFRSLELNSPVVNSTYWANSFNPHNHNMGIYPYQFIKKSFKSIEFLFSNFDILNCCAAYYNGKFYFHDDFENSFDEGILNVKKDFHKKTLPHKIFTAQRYFKYAKRYHLQMSEYAIDSIMGTMLDSQIVLENIKNNNFDTVNKIIDLKNLSDISDPYGRNGPVDIGKIQLMISLLFNYFPTFAKMKQVKKEQILVFVNSDDSNIKKAIVEILKS